MQVCFEREKFSVRGGIRSKPHSLGQDWSGWTQRSIWLTAADLPAWCEGRGPDQLPPPRWLPVPCVSFLLIWVPVRQLSAQALKITDSKAGGRTLAAGAAAGKGEAVLTKGWMLPRQSQSSLPEETLT